MFALNKFFSSNNSDGFFMTYGLKYPEIADFYYPGVNTQDTIFPLLTKCTFLKVGPSGDMQNHDALCVLGLNVYNRYIFLIMWYWFLMLIVLLTLVLIHRILIMLSPWLRYVLLKMPGKNNMRYETSFVAHSLAITDWWVLYLLKSNIDPILFKEVIVELFKVLSQPKAKSNESEKML